MNDNAVNPLLIPLIIKNVYKQLDFDDKKHFRLVCKIWIDAILDLWRKQTKLMIQHFECITGGRLDPRPRTAKFIFQFFNLYRITEKPLLNLKLVNMVLSFLPEEFLQSKQKDKEIARIPVIQTVQNLMARHFGHSVEHLELDNCIFLQKGKPEAGFYHILLKAFPNLKFLSVEDPEIADSFGHEFILDKSSFPKAQSDLSTLCLNLYNDLNTETAKKIFNLIPNLKNLSLQGSGFDVLNALLSPLSTCGRHILLERFRIEVVEDPDKTLKIPALIKNYLETARPPLNYLKASFPFGAFSREANGMEFPDEPFIYTPIWNCVGNTLTILNLRIWMELWRWCTLFTGSPLPNLTHLKLKFRDTNKGGEDLFRFDFGMLRGTPLLEVLHLKLEMFVPEKIQGYGANLEEHELEWKRNEDSPIVLEHLYDFRFDLYHKPTKDCWTALGVMMPKLRKLVGMVDEDTEPHVRQLWPDLNLTYSPLGQAVLKELKTDDELLQRDIC